MTTSFGCQVLAFGPHPDDVELFCGGLMCKLAADGHRAVVVDLTLGERASRGTPETRAQETAAASKVMGLVARENLGLPDAWVNPWGGFDAPEAERVLTSPVARVVEVLRRHRPELVLVPWERERHPDHEAGSALITRALMLAGVKNFGDATQLPFTPRQVLYYPMRQLERASIIVDVSREHPQKMAAVQCYTSQVSPAPDAHPTLVGSTLSLASLEARDRFHGAQIGVAHGEPYILRNAVGVADPLDHFRRNSFGPPLFFPERA